MKNIATSPLHKRTSHNAQRALITLGGLILCVVFSLLFAAAIGSVALPAADLWQALGEVLGGHSSSMTVTLLELRLERALSGFVIGAMLALAGVMMQALLRNPLADPYVLGVSGGAAVGALAAMLFFSAAWMIDLSAFVGAIMVSLLLFSLAYRDLRGGMASGQNGQLLLLTGVIVASGCGALVTLMLTMAPDGRLRSMVFWLMGDLSGTQLRWLPWLVLAGAMIFSLRKARYINVMVQHAEAASTLGVDVGVLKKSLFFCAALLTACTISSAGAIGFVGLIVPHACRFALGPDHRLLLPAAALVGGIFLVLADTLARSILAPQQLPVGVITAFIGVPVFLIQLHHIRKR
ncbi:MAG: iron ABC transporter permease [Glaciimonas sp.]|nr:iron ABC transporter permease [Glaciimonas sp.]